MKKVEIPLSFDEEKLEALEFVLRKEKTTVKKKLDEALVQLYEQSVPEPVREYLESKSSVKDRPRHPVKPSHPKPPTQAEGDPL